MKEGYISDVKYVLAADNVISKLPDYTKFGCKSKLQLNPDYISAMNCQLTVTAKIILEATSTLYIMFVHIFNLPQILYPLL